MITNKDKKEMSEEIEQEEKFEEKEAKEEVGEEIAETDIGKLQVALSDEIRKSAEHLEGWKRCQADFENYKKRQHESHKDLIRYSTQSIILQILPILDNFHASTDHIPDEHKSDPWVIGIMHIQKQLEQALADNGVSEIDVKIGDNFDPAIHEAVEDMACKSCKSKDYKFQNKIKRVAVKGYKMGDKIIRAARVIVE